MTGEVVGPVRILLVDDHALFREGLARLLAQEPDLHVVAACAGAAEALRVLGEGGIDVLLLDVDLGNEQGLDLLAEARSSGFAGAVLLVTAGVSRAEAARLIAQGAAGVFLKRDSARLLATGIRTVASGRAWLDQEALEALVAAPVPAPAEDGLTLSERERQTLRGVLDGLANKEIGARLGLSESAVKAVLQQLFRKTGVRTRSQLVRIALERFAKDL